MKHINTILFDVDGTLLDTSELIFQAFEHTLKEHDHHLTRADIVQVVGKPLTECYQILVGNSEIETYSKIHHDFQLANLHLSKPFPNTVMTLQKLKKHGFKIAAVTSRKKQSALSTMELANITAFMDFSVFADEVTHHKPHPEALLKALTYLGSTPQETLMVGDSDADILGGKNAGTKTVGALYGFHGEKLKDYGPDFFINDISELLPLLDLSLRTRV